MLSLLCFLLHICICLLVKSAKLVNGSGYMDKSIFILAGQSNMAGRGGVSFHKWDGIVPQECKPDPSILRLNARLQWEEAKEPIHIDIDWTMTVGVGPGMSFANKIRELDSNNIGVVGLVPCAIGGSYIREWAKGARLYTELVRRSEASLKEGGRIRAVLWYQGESDTIVKKDAESYGKNLKDLVLNLRDDLKLPNLPFMQVGLTSSIGPYMRLVRKAQQDLDLPYVWYVEAQGLPLEPDNLHLTTQAQVHLGQIMAEAFFSQRTVQETPITSHAHKRAPFFCFKSSTSSSSSVR